MVSRRLLWVVMIGIALTLGVLVANHGKDTVAGLDTYDFGSLVYHVGLVVLVGSGVLVMFRERLSQALEAALNSSITSKASETARSRSIRRSRR